MRGVQLGNDSIFIGGVAGGSILAAGLGLYFGQNKESLTITTSSTTVSTDQSITVTALLTKNKAGYSNQTITLNENTTQSEGTQSTDSTGVATFTVSFPNTGKYSLQAIASDGTKSNSLSITVTSTSPPPTCNCPSGDVCPDSSGNCPSGYVADPNNPGCCTKKQTSCPCGQILVGGVCQTQIPSAVNLPSSAQLYPFWELYANFSNIPYSGCSGYQGHNLNACKTGSGLCNSNTFSFTVTGSVVDSAGNPICGVPLTYEISLPSNLTYPFTTNDGAFSGNFVVGYDVDGNTNSKGEFNANFTVELSLTNITCPSVDVLGYCEGLQSSSQNPVTFTLKATVEGTTIYNALPITINNQMCEQQLY